MKHLTRPPSTASLVSSRSVDVVAVVIPARDEQSTIGACLSAVDIAQACCPVPVRVVVVLDRCVDDTARIVDTHGGVTVEVTTSPGGVGRARDVGARTALAGFDPARVWLAHTDADSMVPSGWLQAMIAHAEHGADVVVGTVTPDLGGALLDAWSALHRSSGCPHVYGANLGVRGSAYLAAGGFDPNGVGEDAALVARTGRLPEVVTVHDGAVPVLTSARRHSHVDGGFASYLDVLARTGAPPRVPIDGLAPA